MRSSIKAATITDDYDTLTNCSVNHYPEGFNATPKRSGSKSSVARSVQKKAGRKRRRRSLGRNPFMTAVNHYLEEMKGLLAEATWVEYQRRLTRMNKDFRTLIKFEIIENSNPWKMTEKEILEYLRLLKNRGLKPSGICHNMDSLNNLLRFVGNGSMDRAKIRYAQNFPKRNSQRLEPISDSDRQKIIQHANKVDDAEWQRMLGYGVTILGICAGLRPKEVRLANIGDLDLERGIIHTEHVKGEDSYGQARNTGIHPDGIPFLRRYVKARASILAEMAPTCEALFPAMQDIRKGGDGYYAPNSLTKLRANVTAQTGVKFDSRSCRRTFGQVCIDAGIPLDAVSRMMGHSNSKTTEKYYCQKTIESAISEAQKVWGKAPNPEEEASSKKVKNPLINNKIELTGYA
jgi:integrase/recombinase XerD